MNKNPEFIEELLKLLSAKDQSKITLFILKLEQQSQENKNLIFDLGVQLAQFNRLSDALSIFTALLNNVKDNIKIPYNIGLIYSIQGKHQDALDAYSRALEINSTDVETLINISSTYIDLKNFNLALEMLNKAISLNPAIADSWSNKGFALSNLARYEEALSSLNRAIEIDPNHIGALSNKVALCNKLNNLNEALELQSRLIDLCPSNPKLWLDKGEILCKLELFNDGIHCYDKALAIEPSYVDGYLNKGAALSQLRKFNEAIKQYDKALSIQSTHSEALFNKGIALHKLGCNDEAILLTRRALEHNPQLADGWSNRGLLLHKLKDYPAAINHFERALELNPDIDWIDGNLLHSRMIICQWSELDRSLDRVIDKVQAEKKVINPFALSALIDDGNLIKRCAEICITQNQDISALKKLTRNDTKKKKITIGYFSANFHNHAVGYLISELFKLHDKNNFELIGFSFGPSQIDETRLKISKEFDLFYEVSNISDLAIVDISRKLGVDIAVDLIGFTDDIRTNVFALRAAPIQVNYLGYPGTMGADYYDYILADKMIIPAHLQVNFSERIAYLPNSYQVNDRERIISEKNFLRHELNLPSTGFVFACFNNNYKILPATFQIWMQILRSVDNSVLWLLADNTSAKDNLVIEAAKYGIDVSRLIFAERMSQEDHLARHKQADLFLDTFPYNAHTTGSDALWAGVPIVTLIGNSFASRVAASLLNAVGLPELITTTQDQYEALAIELALNPEKLSALKVKLAKNKLTEPLFNTPLFTSNLESLYTKMYNRYHDGLEPDHISLS